MAHIRWTSLLLALTLSAIISGCKPAAVAPPPAPVVVPTTANEESGPDAMTADHGAESPKTKENPSLAATAPTVSSSDAAPSKATSTEKPSVPKPTVVPLTKNDGTSSRQEARPFTEAALLPSDVVGLVVVHPKQFFETALGKLAIEMGIETESGEPAELLKRLNLKLIEIDRVTLVIDQTIVNTFAAQNGLPVATIDNGAEPAVRGLSKPQLKNQLEQFGLAFHNYHDTYGKFPRADGDASGKNTGLSWRVHLLPYLDQAPLYNLFHMDEAWDSEHNKSLIQKMPSTFRSPGVTDKEKTAFHVLTGEKTLFHGDEGIGMANITDGTSNSILAVLAAADTAEIWTKPEVLKST